MINVEKISENEYDNMIKRICLKLGYMAEALLSHAKKYPTQAVKN